MMFAISQPKVERTLASSAPSKPTKTFSTDGQAKAWEERDESENGGLTDQRLNEEGI